MTTIKRLGGEEWELAPGDELRDAVVEIARVRSMLEALEVRVAGVFDAHRAWAPRREVRWRVGGHSYAGGEGGVREPTAAGPQAALCAEDGGGVRGG